MLVNRNVHFQHGTILTREMLTETYSFPREFFLIKYSEYDNCIICGLNLFEDDKGIWLTKGIVKYLGDIYFLKDNINLTDFIYSMGLLDKHEHYVLELTYYKGEDLSNGSVVQNFLKLHVSKSTSEKNILLGKFLWRDSGLKLPKVDCKDCISPMHSFLEEDRYNFNVLEVPYIYNGGEAYHPLIVSAVKEYLWQKDNKSFLDFNLLMQLEETNALTVKAVQVYTVACGETKEYDKLELMKIFSKCLPLVNKHDIVTQEKNNNTSEIEREENTEEDECVLLPDW